MQTNYFTCPRCGKRFNKIESVDRIVEISSDVDMSHGYNPYVTKVVTKYYHMRFCIYCNRRLNLNHYLRRVLWFLLPTMVFNLFVKEIDISTIALPLGISLFFFPLAVIAYRDIKMKTPYTKKLIERAWQGDAIDR